MLSSVPAGIAFGSKVMACGLPVSIVTTRARPLLPGRVPGGGGLALGPQIASWERAHAAAIAALHRRWEAMVSTAEHEAGWDWP
jgi:hypothetical protein